MRLLGISLQRSSGGILIYVSWDLDILIQLYHWLHKATPVNTLERDEDASGIWRRYVNTALLQDYAQLFAQLDLQVMLQAPSFDVVYAWRLEQEHKLRARLQQSGSDLTRVMDDAAVARFIAHYERITRHLLDEMPARADILLQLDAARQVQHTRGL